MSVTFVSSRRPSFAPFVLVSPLLSALSTRVCWKRENAMLTYANEIPVSQRAPSKASGRKAINNIARLLCQQSQPAMGPPGRPPTPGPQAFWAAPVPHLPIGCPLPGPFCRTLTPTPKPPVVFGPPRLPSRSTPRGEGNLVNQVLA